MTDPTKSSGEELARAALRGQADAARLLDPAFGDQYHDDAYPAPLTEDTIVPREKLFSRKVLFGWAFAALLFVFIIRMVLPLVFETVKEAVITSMKESVHNTAAPVTAPTRPVPPAEITPAAPAAPRR